MTKEQLAKATARLLRGEHGWWCEVCGISVDGDGDQWCILRWDLDELWTYSYFFGKHKELEPIEYRAWADETRTVKRVSDLIPSLIRDVSSYGGEMGLSKKGIISACQMPTLMD